MIFPRIQSLRARLLLGLILSTVLLQIVASVAVYWMQRRALYDRFDQALVSTTRALIPQVKFDKKGVHFDSEKLAIPEFQRARGPDYFQVWLTDGTVLARSATLGDANLTKVQPGSKPVKYDCLLPRDEPGRAVLITVDVLQKGPPEQRGSPETVLLAVAKETKPIRNDLRTLAWILGGTTAAGAIVAATLAWFVVSRALVPVRELSRQIGRIEPTELGQCVEVARLPSEVQPVAERLNEMLNRVAVAFEREQAFTADAAHEMRTPLAGIRSIAEVATSSPQSPEESASDFREIAQVTTGMQAMVEKLLMLARLDAGQVPLALEPVNLRHAIEPSVMDYANRLGLRNITLLDNIPPNACVLADPNLLPVVLGNVIGNAVEYVNDGGEIVLEAGVSQTEVCLTVANTGCAMDPTTAARVFERFWRDDASRTGNSAHWGLGLSLVSRAMLLMGGTARATIAEGGIFRLSLCLPPGEIAGTDKVRAANNKDNEKAKT